VDSPVLIVIPARFGSTRFLGKPLVKIAGISLIQRVYRICSRISGKPLVVVATDDKRILNHVKSFEGRAVMTRQNHPSGTDRVAEVAKKFKSKVVINVQGDEPLLDPRVIGALAKTMLKDKKLSMATLAHAISSSDDYKDPNVVKVVVDKNGDALYFSRAEIPHLRGIQNPRSAIRNSTLRHVGIYAYRKDFLMKYVRWPQSSLEKLEKLEQLRALENGVKVRVLKTPYHAIGVDVPADVKKVEKILSRSS
jgi:3-deoxy-manno-octulosonate cytidylyltransferase (CMP-KDO synthetase)